MSVVHQGPRAWRLSGSVLLVSCYELGHQPLGLAAPLGALRERGFDPAVRDLSVERLDSQQVESALFVGISVPMHTALRLGLAAAAQIRKIQPQIHICFYGLYASLNAAHLLASGADSVIGGEYLQPLLQWIETLASGRLAVVPGVQTGPEPVQPVLGRPAPSTPLRQGLPDLSRYAQLEHGGLRVPAGYVEATHGCLHTCLHCPITPVYRGRFVALDRGSVLEDIGAQVAAGAGHITFGDPDFLNGPTHAMRLARGLHAAYPQVTFDVTTKVEHILKHRALFPELRELGCLFVVSAFESLSDEVLRRLRKGHGRADAFEALALVRNAGIELHPTFVAFTPWTRLEDYLELYDFIFGSDLAETVAPVQLALRLLIPPGSALLDEVRGEAWLGEPSEEGLTVLWRHPDAGMDRLAQEAWALVERAAGTGEAPVSTLHRLHALACVAAGREHPPAPGSATRAGRLPPARLTESWFC